MKTRYPIGRLNALHVTFVPWLLLIAVALARCDVRGQTIDFIWDQNPPEQNIARYRFYQAIGTNDFALVGSVATNFFTLTTAPAGVPLRWRVTAVADDGLESQPSDELIAVIPTAPGGFRRLRIVFSLDFDPPPAPPMPKAVPAVQMDVKTMDPIISFGIELDRLRQAKLNAAAEVERIELLEQRVQDELLRVQRRGK